MDDLSPPNPLPPLTPTSLTTDYWSESHQALLTEALKRASFNRLADYVAYPKQQVFHANGRHYPERLLMAANRSGKTYCGAAEVAIHLTGRYPDWWDGREFDKANRWWVASETTEVTVAGAQGALMGRIEEGIGTGMLPLDAIIEYKKKAHGFPGAVEYVIVRHGGGGDVQAGKATAASSPTTRAGRSSRPTRWTASGSTRSPTAASTSRP